MVDHKHPIGTNNVLQIVGKFKELSSEEKISTLEEIIHACEPAELKFLSDRLEIFLKRDFVRYLPNEVCVYLLSWLDPISLGRCCLVSKTWNDAVSSCLPAWVQACKSIGWKVNDSNTSGAYWKKAYARALTRIKQLKFGSAFKEGYLLGHAARVYTVKFNGNNLLASGSDDHTVRLWDIETGECLRTIQTHTCADLAFDSYFVYTASFDNTVSCWKWANGELVRNYRGHTGAVFSISYHEERDLLVSGSADKTVRLWQLSTGEQINMYHGHREWVTKVLLKKSNIESLHHKAGDFVVLSMDKTVIKIWIISQEVNCECLGELSAVDSFDGLTRWQSGLDGSEQEHSFFHPQLIFDGSRIMCSSDRGVMEWDFTDYTLTRVTPHCNDPTYLLGAGDMMLFTADTRENCLFIRMPGYALENHSQNAKKFDSQISGSTNHSCLSPSPETVDYEQDAVSEPSCSTRPGILPRFSSRCSKSDNSVTPTDESVEVDAVVSHLASHDDELVNDINFNNIKMSGDHHKSVSVDHNAANPNANRSCAILGRWKLPLCRWSKRGSNYVCGDQSWLNGFSDVNNSGLVFAAALPNHSIYILRWSDFT